MDLNINVRQIEKLEIRQQDLNAKLDKISSRLDNVLFGLDHTGCGLDMKKQPPAYESATIVRDI